MRPSHRPSRRPALIGGALSLIFLGIALVLFFSSGTREVPPEDLPASGDLSRAPAQDATDESSEPVTGPDALAGAVTGAEETEPARPGPPQLSGRVTGEGEGVAGATVHLFSTRELGATILRLERLVPREGQIPDIQAIIGSLRREIDDFRRKELVARTGEDGAYEFRGLSPGGYLVLTLSDEWLFKYGDVVSIPPEGSQRLDIELKRGARLEGQVVHTLGHALSGVIVTAEYRPGGLPGVGRVLHRALQYVNGELLRGPFQRTTGPDGRFSFAGLPPGLYDITAEDPGGVRATVTGIDTNTSSVVVYLGDGASVRGNLIDGEGVPVEGVEVVIESQEDRIQLPLPLATFTDVANSIYAALGEGPRTGISGPDGEFRVAGLPAGRYLFSVDSSGFLPLRRSFEVDWGAVEDMGPVQLSRGESITGVVYSLAGDPIADATVVAVPAQVGFLNAGQALKDFIGKRVTARTDESGTFRLSGLVRGDCHVTAAAEGYASVQKKQAIPATEPLLFALEPGRTIEGRVVTAGDRRPLAGARVRCSGTRDDTDAEGHFVLTGIVPASQAANPFEGGPVQRARRRAQERLAGGTDAPVVLVRAGLEGYLPSSLTVNLDERTDDLEIELAAAPIIRGTVLDPDGRPAPGAILRLTPPIPDEAEGVMSRFGIQRGTIFFGLTVADVEGKFSFQRVLMPGNGPVRLQVLASHPDHASAYSEPFDPRDSDEQVEVEIRLARGAVIKGVVTDGRAPVKGATVRLCRAGPAGDDRREFATFARMFGLPNGGETLYTNAEGEFAFTQILPGDFTLTAEMPQFTDTPEQLVSVDAGDTREVVLVMDPGGDVSGEVHDTGGEPVPGARVRLVREPREDAERDRRRFLFERALGGAYKKTRSDDEGIFRLSGLPDGRYTLIVDGEGYARTEIAGVEPDGRRTDVELVPAAGIQGLVADMATGEPLVNFRVRIVPEGDGGETASREEFRLPRTRSYQDSQGRFRRDDLLPGVYECRVSAEGYVPEERKLRLYGGEPRSEEFYLARAGRIRGVVLDSVSQQPIAGATVRLTEPATDPAGAIPADATGTGDVAESGTAGRVSSARQPTPEEAREEDRRALGQYWRERTRGEGVQSGADGSYLLEGVPPEARVLVVEHPEYIPDVTQGLEIGLGQEIEITVRLKPGRSISGKVLDASGEPASGRFVFLRGTTDGSRHVRKSGQTDGRGEFRVGGLPTGRYRVFSPGQAGRPGTPAVEVVVEENARDVVLRLGEQQSTP